MVNNKRIYQIYCGRWQTANILDHEGEVLRRLGEFDWVGLRQRLDLSHIYLLGLWDVGDRIVVTEEAGIDLAVKANRCPSAFAIVDHSRVWSRLGPNQDLRRLIGVIHDAGMGVYVDYVANHTGLDHPWLSEEPSMYKADETGLVMTAFSGDVVELDYTSAVVAERMMAVGLALAEFGVDGFRCDMAHLVPVSFWRDLIDKIRSRFPKFSFIAEAYGKSVFDHVGQDALRTAGFDGVYDGDLYTNLRNLAAGADLVGLAAHLNYAVKHHPADLIHYLSNHDDSFPLAPEAFMPLWSLISACPGSVLLFNGADSGFYGRLAHHFVEVLPNNLVNGQNMLEADADWLATIVKSGFKITEVEAVGRQLRIKWQTDEGLGQTEFSI